MNKIPNNLKEYRLKAGLTQKDLAAELGFKSEDRISHWEKGQAYPSVPNLLKIEKIFGVLARDIYDK